MKRSILSALVCAGLLSACHKDPTTASSTDKTHFQYINASPSEPYCELYLPTGGAPLIPDFQYLMATGYEQPRLSELNLTIKDGAHGTILSTNGQLPCSKDSFYTWFVYDTFPHIKGYLTTDVLPAATPAGKSAIKFVNLSPNAGTIAYRIKGQSPLATGLKYAGTNPNEATSGFVYMDAGGATYSIEVLDAGTNQVIDSLGTPFYSYDGARYTIYTTGFRGGTGYNTLQTWWTQDH